MLATRHKFKAPVRLTRRNSSRTTHSAGRSRPRRAHEFFSPPASVPRAHVVVDRRPSPRRGKPRRASMLVLRPRDDAAETKKKSQPVEVWNGIEDWMDSQPRDADGGWRENVPMGPAPAAARDGEGKRTEPNERGPGGPAGRPNAQLKKRHVALCAPYAHAAQRKSLFQDPRSRHNQTARSMETAGAWGLIL